MQAISKHCQACLLAKVFQTEEQHVLTRTIFIMS